MSREWEIEDLARELRIRGVDIDDLSDEQLSEALKYEWPEDAAEAVLAKALGWSPCPQQQ